MVEQLPTANLRSDFAAVVAECRQLYLDRLAAIVAEAGVTSATAIAAMQGGAAEFYDEITLRRARAGFEQAHGLTASKLKLVNDEQLQLSIRLGELSRRLFESCEVSVWRVYLRLINLLDCPDLAGADTPVGPEGICCGLGEMCAVLPGALPDKLNLLRAVEERLARDLPTLYADINDLLVRRDVHPNRTQPQPGSAPVVAPYGSGSATAFGAPAGPDLLTELHRAVASRQSPAAAANLAAMTTQPATAAVPAALVAQLLERLDVLQSADWASADLFADATGGGAGQGLLRSLQSGETASMLGAADALSLDVLALVFAAIFDDPRLPDAVKAVIARLQIPVLKAAIMDRSFFDKRSHPARALLDRVARAAVGLPRDTGGEHPVCARLREIATQIGKEFDRDAGVFERCANALESFVAQRDHDIQAAAEAYVPLAEEQERRDMAALAAAKALGAGDDQAVPPVVAEFLRNDWRRVLEAVHLEQGGDGTAWTENVVVINELLWSLAPKRDAEERQRLAAMVPALLRRINAGLARIGVAPAARTAFFDVCFALQTAALHAKAEAPGAAAEAVEPPGEPSSEAQLSSVVADLRRLLCARLPAGSGLTAGYASAALKTGDWVEFILPGGEVRCGRLCWSSAVLRVPMFYNPDWPEAVSMAPAILDRQLRRGDAVVLSSASLFEATAQKALRALA